MAEYTPDGPSHGERQAKVQHLEEATPSTTVRGSDEATSEDDHSPLALTADRLEQPPTEIRSQRLTIANLALFFDYRAKFRGIEWSDLDSLDPGNETGSESDIPYEYQSGGSDEDPTEIDIYRNDEECHDGEGSPRAGEVEELPISRTFGYNTDSNGIMRVLGPRETASLLRRALCMLPSEKIVCLDEVQMLISRLHGEELLEAVRDSLEFIFDEHMEGAPPHWDILRWKIKRSLSLQGIELESPTEIIQSRLEVYSALAELQGDGYLGLRSFLCDALMCWSAESAVEILWKHIAKLPADAQLRFENRARMELDKLQELGRLREEFLALDEE